MPLTRFLSHNRSAIIAVAIAGAAIALVLSVIQPLQYRATMRLLIIQATSPTLDAFTAVKSAEKIGRNLGNVIASSSFLDRVLAADTAIDTSVFSADERKRRRAWSRMVASSVATETSVMSVSVYHPRRQQAAAIAGGVGTVLVRDARDYTGSRDITVRVIDSPIVSRFPVRPNIPMNVLLGLVLGAIFGAVWRYVRRGA